MGSGAPKDLKVLEDVVRPGEIWSTRGPDGAWCDLMGPGASKDLVRPGGVL